jgi:hypothetical protein
MGGTVGRSSWASPNAIPPIKFADMNANQKPHRRYNALTGDWILVSLITPSARGRANKRAQRVKGVPRTTPSAISVRATSAPVTRKIPYTPPPMFSPTISLRSCRMENLRLPVMGFCAVNLSPGIAGSSAFRRGMI